VLFIKRFWWMEKMGDKREAKTKESAQKSVKSKSDLKVGKRKKKSRGMLVRQQTRDSQKEIRTVS